MSKPSAKVLYDYLLNMGHEWVMETYSLSWEEIDDILYGSALPTKERQEKKIKRQRELDEAKGVFFKGYYTDHFIWDEPWALHKKCRESESNSFCMSDNVDEIIEDYKKDISRYHKYVGSGMKPHGWVTGEQEINKNTSKTKEDIYQDLYLRRLNGNLPSINREQAEAFVNLRFNESK